MSKLVLEGRASFPSQDTQDGAEPVRIVRASVERWLADGGANGVITG